ncbi:MAG: hypothetical protein KKG60_02735 [Nanoarchaeota archaeon]|nr:hypothetical protein [Nanoarchaeota archaeon]
MRAVVDTNILFSFFRDNPVRSLIMNSNLIGLELFTPEYALKELFHNKQELMKYSRLKTNEELESILKILRKVVEIKPATFFWEFKTLSKKISPHLKDSPFFALALKTKSFIWSNEPRLKRQDKIKIFNTQELINKLKQKP